VVVLTGGGGGGWVVMVGRRGVDGGIYVFGGGALAGFVRQ